MTRIACSDCGYELWSSWTHELEHCSSCGGLHLDTTTRHVPDQEVVSPHAATASAGDVVA